MKKSKPKSRGTASKARSKKNTSDRPDGWQRADTRDREQQGLLTMTLSVAVPLHIDTLYRAFSNVDGLPAWMVAEVFLFTWVLAERGDRLLFRGKHEGETAEMFNSLARALAVLSFSPGGVPFAEEIFDARSLLSARYGAQEITSFCERALRPYFTAQVSSLPVTCWSEGEDAVAYGNYEARNWFETAGDEQLLRLRANGFRGSASWVPASEQADELEYSLLKRIFEQAHRPHASTSHDVHLVEALGDQTLLEARDQGKTILFQVETERAEAWLEIYKHFLLTGERYVLPVDAHGKRKKVVTRIL